MYKYFLILITLSCTLLAQEKPTPIFIEHNSVIVDSQQVEYISYKIPFNKLLFIKTDGNYSASFSLTLEFYKDDEFVHREITSPSFNVNDYDETNSSERFYQDLLKFNLEPGEYKLKPLLSLGSTNLEYKIPELNLIIDTVLTSKILFPFIVIDTNSKDSLKSKFILANYGGRIPFSPDNYNLVLSINDSLNSYLNFSIEQFEKVVFKDSLTTFTNGSFSLNKNKNGIVLSTEDNSFNNLYLITNFSHLLSEGDALLKFNYGKTKKEIKLKIKWFNKPKILKNPEYSIKLLSYVEKENVVGELLSNDSDLYKDKLSEYWKDKYPANGMNYNYAMNEYYKRADYAIERLSSLNTKDGAERDRGKIYITYGNPTSIERDYTEKNEIVEIWNYESVGRTFVFKDLNGTGKFDLAE